MDANRIWQKSERHKSLYYRRRIPGPLRELIRLGEVRIPLRTPVRSEAEKRAIQIEAAVDQEFDRLREKLQAKRKVDVELIRQVSAWAESDTYNHFLELLQLGVLDMDAQLRLDPEETFERFQTQFNRRILDQIDREACLQAIHGGLLRAKAKLEQASRDRTEVYAAQPLPVVQERVQARLDRVNLDVLVQKYKDHNRLGRKAPGEIDLMVRRLKEFLRTEQVHSDQITPKVVRDFRDTLRKCAVHYAGSGRPKTVWELVDLPGERLSNASVNKTTMWLAAIFGHAVKEQLLQSNPCEGLAASLEKAPKRKRPSYRDDEAKIVFRALKAYREDDPALFWVPQIAARTGARREEICQLRRADVFQEDGIWCLDLHDQGDNQLKTDSSIRRVPIPKAILDLGFLDYVRTRSGLLFDLEEGRGFYGEELGKRYNEQFIPSLDGLREDLVLHSWRHTFKTKCRGVEMPEEIHKRLVGHSDKSVSSGYGEFPIKTLKAWIDRIAY